MKRCIIAIIILAAALLALCSAAQAATYYVSPTGSDTNPGTSDLPFKTIQKAADIVNPGDTVIVRDGTYTDENNDDLGVYLTRGGVPGNYVTFKSENKWKSILDGQKVAGYGFAIANLVGYIIIDGFEISNFLNAGVNINETNTEIIVRQNKIHDIGRIPSYSMYGIDCIDIGTRASHVQVDGNLIYACGRLNPNTNPSVPESSCTTPADYTIEGVPYPNNVACYNHDHGVYIRGDYVNITNNIFYDNKAGWGVHVYEAGIWKEHIYIEGNTFADPNPARNGQVIVTDYSNDVIIQNNIFYNPTNSMINLPDVCDGLVTNLVIRNNLTNVNVVTMAPICDTYTISNNYINKDPLFVDLSNRNYHLLARSPAIDKGIPSNLLTTDFDGISRPQGSAWDIGAYEYVSPYGDVSGDGKVSAYDAALVGQYAVSLITLTPEQITRADVSGDGKVSTYDAALIAQYAVGLISKFPVE